MAYEFKKLSAVEAVEVASDTANVLIEEGGAIKRVPKGEVGGVKVASAAKVGQTIVVKAVDDAGMPTEWECADIQSDWLLHFSGDTWCLTIEEGKTPDEIKEAYNSGIKIFAMYNNEMFMYDGNKDTFYPFLNSYVMNRMTYLAYDSYESGYSECSMPIAFDNSLTFTGGEYGTDTRYYNGNSELTINLMTVKSSTENSSKIFQITVDDSGTISAVEVTE